MVNEEEKFNCFLGLVKDRMDAIGLKYTEEQADQMADWVNGIVTIAQKIQQDCIVNRIKKEV